MRSNRAYALSEMLGLSAGVLGLGAFGTLAYGLYGWLRYKQWFAITVQQSAEFLGIPALPRFGETGWLGLDSLLSKLNLTIDFYYQSNIGWTLAALSMAVVTASDNFAGQWSDLLMAEKRGNESEAGR